MSIRNFIRKYQHTRQWCKENAHNETYPANQFDPALVSVGRKTYGRLYVSMFNKTNKLKIGNFCSIGPDVAFMLSSDHALNHISTFPFRVKYGVAEYEGISKGDIIVEDDVWIGYGATILSGVRLGRGAVIAAGSVVSKDVPPYAVVTGIPAKVVKYRFSQEIIDKLMEIDYEKLDDAQIMLHMDDLYKKVEGVEDLAWLIEDEK